MAATKQPHGAKGRKRRGDEEKGRWGDGKGVDCFVSATFFGFVLLSSAFGLFPREIIACRE
jgi:hypothetical protein